MSDTNCGAVHIHDDCWVISDCKYAELKASHAELVAALKYAARWDGEFCWCELPRASKLHGHDINCQTATAALRKAEALK